MPKLTPALQLTLVDPAFAGKWKSEVHDAYISYLVQDFEDCIRRICTLYGMTFEEMVEESGSEHAGEWKFDLETAEYFLYQEGFDVDKGDFK